MNQFDNLSSVFKSSLGRENEPPKSSEILFLMHFPKNDVLCKLQLSNYFNIFSVFGISIEIRQCFKKIDFKKIYKELFYFSIDCYFYNATLFLFFK